MSIPFLGRYAQRKAALQQEFLEIIDTLLANEQVRRLDTCRQHFKYTRLRHSMDVAYRSFVAAKLLRLDSRAVARGGLLHDLFFHREGQNSASLLFSHPRIALKNARQVCVLSRMEEDIILKHMFYFSRSLPRYRESCLVTVVDLYSATLEFLTSPFRKAGDCAANLKPLYD